MKNRKRTLRAPKRSATALDFAIKQFETKGKKQDKYYNFNGAYHRRYYNYMDNETWDAFILEMKGNYPLAWAEYSLAYGEELKGKHGHPPKMASYGSSSRMIYLLSRKILNFQFEYKLHTTIGGSYAYLDGYLFRNGTNFYIEAKCREPYDFKKQPIPAAYKELYEHLTAVAIGFASKIVEYDDGRLNVDFYIQEKKIKLFDLKQTICHLLGIAAYNLKYPTNEKTHFVYLLYNPSAVEEYIEPKYRNEIFKIYNTELMECHSIPMRELYGAIMNYLHKVKTIGSASDDEVKAMIDSFSFDCCDQKGYKKLLHK